VRPPQLAAFFISRAGEKRPQQGVGLSWGRPFRPPATRKQAANGQPNYRNSVDRSELVWSTSVGGLFHMRLNHAMSPIGTFDTCGLYWAMSALRRNSEDKERAIWVTRSR